MGVVAEMAGHYQSWGIPLQTELGTLEGIHSYGLLCVSLERA